MSKTYLSVEGRKALMEEKERLLEKRKELRKKMKDSKPKRESSNTTFINGSRYLQRMSEKISEINDMLKNAEIINTEEIDTETVCPGCEVVICLPSGQEEKYVFALEDPECSNRRISPDAPLGKVILGKKEGEIVEYRVNGEVKEVKIKNII
ncbi:MAG: GreA/GreB family elongation factor [Patescibacteria group bacterium]